MAHDPERAADRIAALTKTGDESRTASDLAPLSAATVVSVSASALTALGALLGPLYVFGILVTQRQIRISYATSDETAWQSTFLEDRFRIILHALHSIVNPSIFPVIFTLTLFSLMDNLFASQDPSELVRVTRRFVYRWIGPSIVILVLSVLLIAYFCSFIFDHVFSTNISDFVAICTMVFMILEAVAIYRYFVDPSMSGAQLRRVSVILQVLIVHFLVGILAYRILFDFETPYWVLGLTAIVVGVCSLYVTSIVRSRTRRASRLLIAFMLAYSAALVPVYWVHVRPGDYSALSLPAAVVCQRHLSGMIAQYVSHSDGYWYVLAPPKSFSGQANGVLLALRDDQVEQVRIGVSGKIGQRTKSGCK